MRCCVYGGRSRTRGRARAPLSHGLMYMGHAAPCAPGALRASPRFERPGRARLISRLGLARSSGARWRPQRPSRSACPCSVAAPRQQELAAGQSPHAGRLRPGAAGAAAGTRSGRARLEQQRRSLRHHEGRELDRPHRVADVLPARCPRILRLCVAQCTFSVAVSSPAAAVRLALVRCLCRLALRAVRGPLPLPASTPRLRVARFVACFHSTITSGNMRLPCALSGGVRHARLA